MDLCSQVLVERADDTTSLDVILLLLNDLRLRFYDVPEFEHVFLDLLDVTHCSWQIASSHLLDICLELADAFMHNFGIDVTLRCHLSVWCSSQHNLLNTEGLQELTDMQFISIVLHEETLLYLLKVNIFLLEIIKNICEGLQSQKIACRDKLRTWWQWVWWQWTQWQVSATDTTAASMMAADVVAANAMAANTIAGSAMDAMAANAMRCSAKVVSFWVDIFPANSVS